MNGRRRVTLLAIALVVPFLPRPLPVRAASGDAAEPQMRRADDAYRTGDLPQAALAWEEAARLFEAGGKPSRQSDALVRLSHVHLALGYPQKAADTAREALAVVKPVNDEGRTAAALATLGNALAASGVLDDAERSLQDGLARARQAGENHLIAAIANDLGNFHAARGSYADALAAYSESMRLARQTGDHVLAARVANNAAVAALQSGSGAQARAWLDQAAAEIAPAEPSHETADALISIARTCARLRGNAQDDQLIARQYRLLDEASRLAQSLGDRRTGSYAWGDLGTLYEHQGRYADALQLTQRAIFAAQAVDLPEALYQWDWQAGRLLRAQGRRDEAIGSYRMAVHVLQTIRPEMRSGYGNHETPFDQSIKPVYLDLVDLLLQRAADAKDAAASQPDLVEARKTMESFKVAELQDYFHDDCFDANRPQVSLENISPHVAVIYPIALPNRIALLITLPTGLKRVSVPVAADRLTAAVRDFRRRLEDRDEDYLRQAQTLYDWLIRPLEPDLSAFHIDTLVFVPSGVLLTIPMAALHDGQDFLVAKYALAITPALQLTDPHPFPHGHVKLLLLGLTQAVQGFPALPNVATELDKIRDMYGGTVLLNRDFELPRLQHAVEANEFNVVHIASHGEFRADVDKTFVLTFDGRLGLQALDQWVGLFKSQRAPLELLALSACETASGDERAALGLAGIAVKAGARSALASLWSVDDRVAALITVEFYRQLGDPSVSKATALQRAQLKVLEHTRFQHPGYWSAFLVINNWL